MLRLSLILAALMGAGHVVRGVTLTVTNLNDSGAGSLRQAIADASPNDTIVFDGALAGVITLTSGELVVTTNLTITELRIVDWAKLGEDLELEFTSMRAQDYWVIAQPAPGAGAWVLETVPGNGSIANVLVTNVPPWSEVFFSVRRVP